MVMPPYHGATFRVPESAIYDFYRGVSDAISIPIMVQDAPVAGTPLSVPFLARMAKEIENLAYFKVEVPRAAEKLRALIEAGGAAIEGPWDGEEAITLMADLDAGATGAMTGGGYPDGIRQIIDPYFAGKREEAIDAYQRWLPLINYENRQAGLAACKVLMKEGGVIKHDTLRAPQPAMHPATRAGLIEIARRLDPVVLRWGALRWASFVSPSSASARSRATSTCRRSRRRRASRWPRSRAAMPHCRGYRILPPSRSCCATVPRSTRWHCARRRRSAGSRPLPR
jgi:4-hydroxy-tetrahydrodipicolinate synthase